MSTCHAKTIYVLMLHSITLNTSCQAAQKASQTYDYVDAGAVCACAMSTFCIRTQ